MTAMPCNLKRVDTSENYENNEAVRRLRHSKDNVPLESIKLDQVIGEVSNTFVFWSQFMYILGRVRLSLQGELHEQLRCCEGSGHQGPEQ